jgi:hypothetical protein
MTLLREASAVDVATDDQTFSRLERDDALHFRHGTSQAQYARRAVAYTRLLHLHVATVQIS